MIKIVELFAGVGGFRKGFVDATKETHHKISFEFVSEWDKHAQTSYEAIWGEKPQGDITKINAVDVPNHDILLAGMPCQAFSIAGKMKGFEDTRGTLFFDVARIAQEKKPKAILIENVKGLINHDNGNTLEVMVRTLNDIGYVVDYHLLNSKKFNVPQGRERIYIVAIREDLQEYQPWDTKGTTIVPKSKKRISEKIEVKSFHFNVNYPTSEKSVQLRELLEENVDSKYVLSKENSREFLLKEFTNECVMNNVHKEKILNTLSSSEANVVLPSLTPKRLNKRQNGRRYRTEEISHTITTQDRHGVIIMPEVLFHALIEYGAHEVLKEIGETILDKVAIRNFTPLECWRLQAFSDEEFNLAKQAGISDSQLYKQAGNSVTTTVIKALATEIYNIIDKN